jgi:Ca2+-binding EF-hand superfamily protein
MAAVDLSKIPNLPGYGFKRKQKNYHKAQTFQNINGQRIECQVGVTFERPNLVQVPRDDSQRRVGTLPESSTHEGFKDMGHTHTQRPKWDAFDRHVLRFYGHFQEAVFETNLEAYRNRHCVLYYFLEDDTMHVAERKQDNSGIPQGQLIRRHRFPAAQGGYISWQDLTVGEVLHVYGRHITLTDCDGFTREFFQAKGIQQGQDPEPEPDAFETTCMQREVKGPPGIPNTHERHYNEVQLGGGHINTNMQQFMEWDRKVCRFYAIVDDLMTPQHERRPFEILFFLADDTVEIREKYPLNCGRDNFPIFFRRGKLPRDTVGVQGPFNQPRQKDEFVAVTDFGVGRMVELMRHHFFFYDADDFTRAYFQEELGIELEECQDVRLPERTVPRPPTPPYNGYGSWDDSMGNVHHLIPSPPRRDCEKIFNESGKILRFTAQIACAKPEDVDRQFIVLFHLFDDTLSIHEPPQRNLGIMTGRYLEKSIHTNQITGELFKPADLYPGSRIKVYNQEFEICGMDEFTRKYFEEGGVKRQYDLSAILEKMRENLRQQFPLVRDIFRRFDTDHDGVITMREFQQALKKWGFQPSEEEALTLMKHFDARQDGKLSYNEFCDALLDEDYTGNMMKMKPPIREGADETYIAKAKQQLLERDENAAVLNAVRMIGDCIYKHTQTFQKLMKMFAKMTHEKTVTCEQIVYAFAQFGHLFDVEDVKRCVLYVLGPEADLQAVSYFEFLKAVVASFHDLNANR